MSNLNCQTAVYNARQQDFLTETRSHNPPVKTDSTVDKAIYIKINFYRIIQVSDFFGFSDVVAFGGVGSGNVSGNNAGCCKG